MVADRDRVILQHFNSFVIGDGHRRRISIHFFLHNYMTAAPSYLNKTILGKQLADLFAGKHSRLRQKRPQPE